jgi:hypothetical protein
MKLKSPIKAAEGLISPRRCRADREGVGVSGNRLDWRMSQWRRIGDAELWFSIFENR